MGWAVVALFVLGTGAASTRPSGGSVRALPVGLAVSAGLAVDAPGAKAPPALTALAAPAPTEQVAPAPPPGPGPGDVVIAPPPAVFDGPPAPAPPPPLLDRPVPATRSLQSAGTWAVIIGINDYPGSRSDLRSAVNDANDVDLALAGMGVPGQNRLVLRDGQATANTIRRSIDWLVSHAGPDATAVFFYGGHVRKVGPTSEALVAADGALIGDQEVGERLAHLAARRAWIAIAACYGGGFTEVLAPGRILTGAAGADELAYESSQYARSYMVQYMVRQAMIEKRAPASVQAAFAYAAAELAREHAARQPVQLDMAPGPLDLRPAVAQPPPAPSNPSTTLPPTPPTTTCRQLLVFGCR